MRRWALGAAGCISLLVGGFVLVTQMDGEPDNPWEGITQLDLADAPEDVLAPCAEWRTRPVTQDEVVWGCSDGEYADAVLGIYRCDDGRFLYSVSNGWGYVGEPMRDTVSGDPDGVAPASDLAACGERLYPDPST